MVDHVHSRDKRMVVWVSRATKLKLLFGPTDTLKNVQLLGQRGVDDFTTDLPPDILPVI